MPTRSRLTALPALIAAQLVFAACSSDPAPAPETALPGDRKAADAGASPPGAAFEAGAPEAGLEPITTPDETAGTRLRPQYTRTRGADGLLALAASGAWYDTAREETCWLQELSDGKLHCAPFGDTPAFDREHHFQDAACTLPVVGLRNYRPDEGRRCYDPERPAGRRLVAVRPGVRQCEAPQFASLPAGPPLSVHFIYRRTAPGGPCEHMNVPAGDFEIYAAPRPLEVVPPSSFVAFTSKDETPATGHRLRPTRTIQVGDDGSRAMSRMQIVDSERGEICSARRDIAGDLRCFPDGGQLHPSTPYHSISTCASPVFPVENRSRCDRDPRYKFAQYIERADPTSCHGGIEILPRYHFALLDTVYSRVGDACLSAQVTPNDQPSVLYYGPPLLAALPATSFAPLRMVFEDAAPRVYGSNGSRLVRKLSGVADASGFKALAERALFDQELGLTCVARTLQDGKTYCVGGHGRLSVTVEDGVFADPTCTDPAVGIYRGRPGCAAEAPRFYAPRERAQNGCETMRLLERNPRATTIGAVYRKGVGGTCAHDASFDLTYQELYRLSDLTEVPPTRFVSLQTELTY